MKADQSIEVWAIVELGQLLARPLWVSKLGCWQLFLFGWDLMPTIKIQFVVLWQAGTSHPVSGCYLGLTTCVQPWIRSTFGWTPGSLVVTSRPLRWTNWLQLLGGGILLHRLPSPNLPHGSLNFTIGATLHAFFTHSLTFLPCPWPCVGFVWTRIWFHMLWACLDLNTSLPAMLEHPNASPGSCECNLDLTTC